MMHAGFQTFLKLKTIYVFDNSPTNTKALQTSLIHLQTLAPRNYGHANRASDRRGWRYHLLYICVTPGPDWVSLVVAGQQLEYCSIIRA